MIYLLAIFLAVMQPSAAPRQSLSGLIDGIDRTYGRMSDLSADFVQIFEDPLNRKQQESGHVYLMRPRMMRWEYKTPEEKLFVSDGRTVYMYVPADRQVNKETVRESLDDRIPLMFLVGRSDLANEFDRIEMLSRTPAVEGTQVLRLTPKRTTDFEEIIIEVDPANYQIRRLFLSYHDGSRSDFTFSNIRTNTGLRASLFDFAVPAGVEILEGIGQN